MIRAFTLGIKTMRPVFAWCANFAGLVFGVLTFWTAWQFMAGVLPNPLKVLDYALQPDMPMYSVRPILSTGDPFSWFKWLAYYCSGLVAYLFLGGSTMRLMHFFRNCIEIGFAEAAKQATKQRDESRRETSKWRRELEARNAEAMVAESNKQKESEWGFGALIFGIFLGFLLFHK